MWRFWNEIKRVNGNVYLNFGLTALALTTTQIDMDNWFIPNNGVCEKNESKIW